MEINFIEAVTERDIDLLLLEELSVSDAFVNWIIGQTAGHENPVRIGVWHSLMDAEFGESDLTLLYRTVNEPKTALLIENKIDAVVQPKQAERYRERGDKGVTDDRWDSYQTCLVAPERYLQSTSNAHAYDHVISYEKIRDWFLEHQNNEPRYAYKTKMVQEAIEKNRRGYTIVPDDRVSEFWIRYWQLASRIAPDLEMRHPSKKPAKSCWIAFKPSKFPSNMRIVHKLDRGFVDLEIRSAASRSDELVKKLQSIIPSGVSIEITGKSLSLRKEVSIINHFGAFDDQKDIVENGIQTAQSLLELGVKLVDYGLL